jgi:hypothetical protein
MPVGGFSIGRDISVQFNTPQGPVKFSNITSFGRKAISVGLESKGINGIDLFATIYGGWEGTIELDRMSPALDLFFAFMENLYYTGQDVPPSFISEKITERNGALTQFTYPGVAWQYTDAGTAKGDEKITQSASWKASRRLPKS